MLRCVREEQKTNAKKMVSMITRRETLVKKKEEELQDASKAAAEIDVGGLSAIGK